MLRLLSISRNPAFACWCLQGLCLSQCSQNTFNRFQNYQLLTKSDATVRRSSFSSWLLKVLTPFSFFKQHIVVSMRWLWAVHPKYIKTHHFTCNNAVKLQEIRYTLVLNCSYFLAPGNKMLIGLFSMQTFWISFQSTWCSYWVINERPGFWD